jgi:hypothetical protein
VFTSSLKANSQRPSGEVREDETQNEKQSGDERPDQGGGPASVYRCTMRNQSVK